MGATLVFATTFTSCSDEQLLTSGEGTVMIRTTVNTDVKVKARTSADELGEKCLIHIYNPKGLVRRYNGIAELPAEGIKLVSDNYIAEAWTGDSVSASFTDRWFKGRSEFTVRERETTYVNLTCKIANVVAAVKYDEAIDEFMSSYTMTVGHSRGTLDFEGRDERLGYFMMPNADKSLTWTLNGTLANGEAYTRTGKIDNVKPATLYTLNVIYNDKGSAEVGGGYFTIEVDESALEINDEVEIALSAVYTGVGFNIDEPVFAEVGKVGRHEIIVGATSAINSFIFAADNLTEMTGVTGNDVDFMNATEEVVQQLHNAGLSWTYTYHPEEDNSTLNIVFSEKLLNSLTEGTYNFNMSTTDANNKTSNKTFVITVTDADVTANPLNAVDVWATHATLTGRILKSTATNPGFMYRKTGTSAWSEISDVTVNGTTFSAELTGLEPGTEYEVIATATDYTSTDIRRFTTETAAQIPNSNFEDWWMDGKIQRVYGQGQQMFWDSGNTASAGIMSVNVTVPATDKHHSGKTSAKLASQFVGVGAFGKFAAGNMFIGEFLRADGTNGVLGWGRTWATRPTELTGWYHYTPGAIEYTSSDLPDVKKGDMDAAKIYIALLDNSISKEDDGKAYPVIVKTKEKEFFSENDSNVIAYGELVINEATAGEDMVPFTIKLNYKRTDVIPSFIMVTMSASQYGDYFAGGVSTLYVDDLKLVY